MTLNDIWQWLIHANILWFFGGVFIVVTALLVIHDERNRLSGMTAEELAADKSEKRHGTMFALAVVAWGVIAMTAHGVLSQTFGAEVGFPVSAVCLIGFWITNKAIKRHYGE